MTTQAPEAKPAEGEQEKQPQQPAVRMVPESELQKAHGRIGELTSRLNAAEARIQSFNDREELRQKKGPVTDEERASFDEEIIAARNQRREADALMAQARKELRQATLARLKSEYPKADFAPIEALGEETSTDRMEALASKAHYTALLAEKDAAPNPEKSAQPATPANRVDTRGAGSSTAAPGQLTSLQKRQIGMERFIERTAAAREQVLAPRRSG